MSIKDRFNEKFPALIKEYPNDAKEILAFFAAELTLLAEEVQELAKIPNNLMDIEQGKVEAVYVRDVFDLIRQKADGLK